MARADRRRVAARERMLRPGARTRRTGELAAIEDTMFFPKLRRHAKWMFVFLALVFGVGFVVFGIGANQAGTSLGDLLAASGGDDRQSSPSRTRASGRGEPEGRGRASASSRPRSQQTARRARRSPHSSSTSTLRPKDEDALRELPAST